ncbi:hypothetical protein AMYX_16680 [Anaeromyxobacter diazotrophicus]|uniref:Uncharacterized protein n=2 Tax=Anaeromyxobacter diazotrophicus TaxID=2590199 RepID=A0A7I9VLR1_9BACT|nr:hypothetical protein AMYX_16680 [Anaeromyxobacter diazotrophicus]
MQAFQRKVLHELEQLAQRVTHLEDEVAALRAGAPPAGPQLAHVVATNPHAIPATAVAAARAAAAAEHAATARVVLDPPPVAPEALPTSPYGFGLGSRPLNAGRTAAEPQALPAPSNTEK